MEIGSIRGITQVYGQSNISANSYQPIEQDVDKDKPQGVGTLGNQDEDDGRKVIGISSDGDTAKASPEAIEELNDGMVVKKESENIGSLTGYSKDELERLEVTGQITQIAYEREIERRDQIQDQDNGENQGEITAVDETKSSEAAKVTEADIVKEQEKAAEGRKEIISEELAEDSDFVNRMNKLSFASDNIQLQLAGMQDAIANGRGEIVSQIFEEGFMKGITQI